RIPGNSNVAGSGMIISRLTTVVDKSNRGFHIITGIGRGHGSLQSIFEERLCYPLVVEFFRAATHIPATKGSFCPQEIGFSGGDPYDLRGALVDIQVRYGRTGIGCPVAGNNTLPYTMEITVIGTGEVGIAARIFKTVQVGI